MTSRIVIRQFIKLTFLIVILILFLFWLNRRPYNYPYAHLQIINGQTFVKLKGKRYFMVHDPISLLEKKMYEDSILLLINLDGITKGENIQVEKGYYHYKGEVVAKNNKVAVNLFIDNTDDKKVEPCDWNGQYKLIK